MAMVITNKLKYDTPILHMGGVDIGMSNEIKVLGLTIDRKLTFNSHVSQACRKAAGLYKMLARSAKVQWGLGPEVIRTIYTAAVEPVILYAASAWAPASQKLGVRKQLGTIQRSFAQKLTKAYRTASLNSTLLLAGILPLDIRVRETALLYEVKRGYSQRVVGDREIEAPVAFASLDHPAERSSGSFQCLVDGAELAQHVGEGLSIFTDGSKIDGKVGAALSIWNGAAETSTRKLRLEPYCSVYQAELLALRKAVEEALHSGLPTCGIFSDARSALEVVTSGDSLHPIAFDINNLLKKASKRTQKIKFFWVKAHVGLEGNERADELAKAAALHLKTRAHYGKCPVSFVKREIRRASIDEWSRRYADGETASTTKLFFPDAAEAHRVVRKIVPDPLLTQVFTGHGGFSEYLHRFKCKESPACLCDPDVRETVPHLLLECTVHAKERWELEVRLGLKITIDSIPRIMKNKVDLSIFLKYCKIIVNKVIKRNSN
ncbi:hypothetical protein O3G_MSEX004674 [Manduca sexta]|uniref:RNase H type-1 domain-containing protein n=1 Tax=Manduca sexta TaxID=7130 RepID=A0A921YW48_MANSE|nr:hypothetical protein O3G_MSEX004674 [Manduca sexta]